MKKQVKKITLKTDKIVNLTKSQSQQVAAGRSIITGFLLCEILTTKTI
ncbi:class I lanthipeptide [Rhodocytophaga aerolata]|uniref:Class I lanthipeptide n=1 Tax=Rhodocytophaga aerolata TaxID=455078 RepID=A0ABT8R9M7_9BACT|nr:class I lanthipeptide [Rhodocytophaga aerolata]MDO1448785.1 class I lanthipeptide [Rhodocytophaga aerolata]